MADISPTTEFIIKLVTAGTAACMADLVAFPFDTLKVRLQIQGETPALSPPVPSHPSKIGEKPIEIPKLKGVMGTLAALAREEGALALYNGLIAGLVRQMAFSAIRIGLYEDVKGLYHNLFFGKSNQNLSTPQVFTVRIASGITTGMLAVLVAQPTEVVKIRLQAQIASRKGPPVPLRYTGTLDAFSKIYREEGIKEGLWKGCVPNMMRTGVVNVGEIVCYDSIKTFIINRELMRDAMPCHFLSGVIAGFVTTFVASPIDVLKTRYMNSKKGQYTSIVDCTVKMYKEGGVKVFYKGFFPNFYRLVTWNIVLWVSFEQLNILLKKHKLLSEKPK